MLRTAQTYTDRTLLLYPGDHPFIKHESTVDYSSIERLRVSAIERLLAIGRCHLHPDMSPQLLRSVRAGLLASPRTVHAFRDYCQNLSGFSP